MYHVTFPPRSNRASWTAAGLITDLDDNPVDLTGCSLVFQISGPFEHDAWCEGCPVLMASSANGKIAIIGLGLFQWSFTLQEMKSLCPGTYQTGLTISNDDGTQTEQFFVGPLAIIPGVVP
jgi:hypothetical protein